MRISDWSSDVCSSDLFVEAGHQGAAAQLQFADLARRQYFTAVRIDDAPLIAVDGATRRASLAVGQARIERFCAVHREGFAHAEQIGLQVRRGAFAALIAEQTEADDGVDIDEIGRASCRERVCQYG